MTRDLQFTVESKPGVGDILAVWIPRVIVAALFIWIGSGKFSRDGLWVRVFARIGFGQWFRYLTGVMQVGGALLLLVPRATAAGAVLIGCTLVGAVVAQIVVFHSLAAIIPGLLLIAIVFVGLRGI